MNASILTIVRVPIDSIHEHPQNPRKGNVPRIAESLRVNGQYVPVVVQTSTGNIVKGNHTWLAAKSNGDTEIDVVYRDVDDTAALRILVGDNHASDDSTYQGDVLAVLLQQLVEAEALDGTGYTQSDLNSLMKSLADDSSRRDDGSAQLDDVTYSLVIGCTDETHQGQLLSELLERGLDVRPVML